MNNVVWLPFNSQGVLLDGRGLAVDGLLWVGDVDKDPQSYPVGLWVDGVAVVNPVAVVGGVVPVLMTDVGAVSLLLLDRWGRQVWYLNRVLVRDLPCVDEIVYLTDKEGNIIEQIIHCKSSGDGDSDNDVVQPILNPDVIDEKPDPDTPPDDDEPDVQFGFVVSSVPFFRKENFASSAYGAKAVFRKFDVRFGDLRALVDEVNSSLLSVLPTPSSSSPSVRFVDCGVSFQVYARDLFPSFIEPFDFDGEALDFQFSDKLSSARIEIGDLRVATNVAVSQLCYVGDVSLFGVVEQDFTSFPLVFSDGYLLDLVHARPTSRELRYSSDDVRDVAFARDIQPLIDSVYVKDFRLLKQRDGLVRPSDGSSPYYFDVVGFNYSSEQLVEKNRLSVDNWAVFGEKLQGVLDRAKSQGWRELAEMEQFFRQNQFANRGKNNRHFLGVYVEISRVFKQYDEFGFVGLWISPMTYGVFIEPVGGV